MSDTIIKVENLGKLYKLGEIGTGTLSHDLTRWLALVRGKEDPYAKIGQANDRSKRSESDYVWALKDINFEVKQGEVLGIIGRNGAGKSTLLKILSKVTSPSTGTIKVRGRIASLLEVGTGFHPELTGRENIFLNGAILGMTRVEIWKKFDQIVDFAGVERYIDTPVKRYSSGMYVRLAFAVAAFLEPEILIVDEVLAVGDSDFQKKCLGRMKDVSVNEGRTILFVSHNLDTISHLCSNGILLHNGEIECAGPIASVISTYESFYDNLSLEKIYSQAEMPGNNRARLISVRAYSEGDYPFFDVSKKIFVEVKYVDTNDQNRNTAIIHLKNSKGLTIFASNEFSCSSWESVHDGASSVITATCQIPGNFLSNGQYAILAAIGEYSPDLIHAVVDDVIGFTVVDQGNSFLSQRYPGNSWPGVIRPHFDWSIIKEAL